MLILILAIAAVFLIGDAIMIPLVMRPLFAAHIGPLMLESLRLWPALLFYVIHIGGLTYFAALPALRTGTPLLALFNGALIGLIAYSCYEMTSYTIMRDWHVKLVVTDIVWGMAISGLAAWLGVLAARISSH